MWVATIARGLMILVLFLMTILMLAKFSDSHLRWVEAFLWLAYLCLVIYGEVNAWLIW